MAKVQDFGTAVTRPVFNGTTFRDMLVMTQNGRYRQVVLTEKCIHRKLEHQSFPAMYGSTMLTQIIEEIQPGQEIHCFLNLPWRFSMAVQVKRHEKRLRIADLEYSDWSEHSRPIHFWKALSASQNLSGKWGC